MDKEQHMDCYQHGTVPFTAPTKPVVTQADRDAAADLLTTPGSSYIGIQAMNAVADRIRRGIYDEHPWVQAFAKHRLASQAVVSQDLVPVSGWVERIQSDIAWTKKHCPNAPYVGIPIEVAEQIASAIEAAQIAARNQALDEAAKRCDRQAAHYRSKAARHDPLADDTLTEYERFESNEGAAVYLAEALRALRTPSQHQEGEG